MVKLVDMTGVVVGRLTVKERAPLPSHLSRRDVTNAYWRCECTCGKFVVRSGITLRRQARENTSCGCWLLEMHAARRRPKIFIDQTEVLRWLYEKQDAAPVNSPAPFLPLRPAGRL